MWITIELSGLMIQKKYIRNDAFGLIWCCKIASVIFLFIQAFKHILCSLFVTPFSALMHLESDYFVKNILFYTDICVKTLHFPIYK